LKKLAFKAAKSDGNPNALELSTAKRRSYSLELVVIAVTFPILDCDMGNSNPELSTKWCSYSAGIAFDETFEAEDDTLLAIVTFDTGIVVGNSTEPDLSMKWWAYSFGEAAGNEAAEDVGDGVAAVVGDGVAIDVGFSVTLGRIAAFTGVGDISPRLWCRFLIAIGRRVVFTVGAEVTWIGANVTLTGDWVELMALTGAWVACVVGANCMGDGDRIGYSKTISWTTGVGTTGCGIVVGFGTVGIGVSMISGVSIRSMWSGIVYCGIMNSGWGIRNSGIIMVGIWAAGVGNGAVVRSLAKIGGNAGHWIVSAKSDDGAGVGFERFGFVVGAEVSAWVAFGIDGPDCDEFDGEVVAGLVVCNGLDGEGVASGELVGTVVGTVVICNGLVV
jgi:hypothetical protein